MMVVAVCLGKRLDPYEGFSTAGSTKFMLWYM